ncbi:MAG TPA: type II secretion system protein GspM [Bdellovibrionota bacterium]|nr:type II secretion system protein GspM [Bdellovibrionota bacterium]
MNLPFDRWRELLGQLEVVKTYYARLTERERLIVLGSVAAGILFIMIVIYSALLAATASMDSRIEKNRKNMKRLQELQSVYIQSERQIRELDQMIRRTDPSFQAATHLEQLARRYGITIDSLKDRPGPPNDLYRETQVSVSVRQITLRALMSYLFDIETSRQLLRVSSLQVRPNFTDPTLLQVTFVVSTFQPSQGT